jgi:hypothetical protein
MAGAAQGGEVRASGGRHDGLKQHAIRGLSIQFSQMAIVQRQPRRANSYAAVNCDDLVFVVIDA